MLTARPCKIFQPVGCAPQHWKALRACWLHLAALESGVTTHLACLAAGLVASGRFLCGFGLCAFRAGSIGSFGLDFPMVVCSSSILHTWLHPTHLALCCARLWPPCLVWTVQVCWCVLHQLLRLELPTLEVTWGAQTCGSVCCRRTHSCQRGSCLFGCFTGCLTGPLLA